MELLIKFQLRKGPETDCRKSNCLPKVLRVSFRVETMAASYVAARSATLAAPKCVVLRKDCAKCAQPQSAFLGAGLPAKAGPLKALGRPVKNVVRADVASTIPKEVRLYCINFELMKGLHCSWVDQTSGHQFRTHGGIALQWGDCIAVALIKFWDSCDT